jgi:hypothetical protein
MKTSLINKFASFLHYHFGNINLQQETRNTDTGLGRQSIHDVIVLIGLSERIDWLQLLGTSHREKNKKEKLYDDISDVRLL